MPSASKSFPPEYWGIEFMRDGRIEIERYGPDGEIADEHALEVLFQQFAD
jgi:hypothetical protein